MSAEREKYSERRGAGAHEMEIQLAHATEDREEQQRRDAPGSEAAIIRCAGGQERLHGQNRKGETVVRRHAVLQDRGEWQAKRDEKRAGQPQRSIEQQQHRGKQDQRQREVSPRQSCVARAEQPFASGSVEEREALHGRLDIVIRAKPAEDVLRGGNRTRVIVEISQARRDSATT